ncbi:MAG: hypothetical protein IIA45_02720 [Bacteroidetes bacterium]|nr:hypothetical protein [Bacteroidota bacterium]
MRNHFFILIIILIFGFSTINESSIILNEDQNECLRIIESDSLYVTYVESDKLNNDYGIIDGYNNIDSIRIEDNCLIIPVTCGGVDRFELIWCGVFAEKYPPSTGLILFHENTSLNKDGRFLVLKYDLSDIKSKIHTDKLQLNIKAYGQPDFNKNIMIFQ